MSRISCHRNRGHHLFGLLQEIALHEIHAAREQDCHAGRVLDEFGNSELAGIVRLVAHGFDALLVFLVLRQVGHVAAVDLEVMRRNVLEQLEGIQPRAELLKGEAAMQLFEPAHECARRFQVGDNLAFRHFKDQGITTLAGVLQLQRNPGQQARIFK